MKHSKFLFVVFISVFLLTCESDDDAGSSANTITPTVTANLSLILALPPGSNITNLVTFEGQNPFDYLAELEVGQSLRLEQPTGLAPGEALLYSRIYFFEENPLDPGQFDVQIDTLDVYDVWLDRLRAAPNGADAFVNPNDQGRSISNFFELSAIDAEDNDDIDYKYDIEVAVREADGSISDYYYIDPKIRIKSRN